MFTVPTVRASGYRYDNLTAAMSFIKGEHTDYLGIVKRIEDLYEGACKEKGAYAKDNQSKAVDLTALQKKFK